MTGDLDLGVNDLIFNDLILGKHATANSLVLMNKARDTYKDFLLGVLRSQHWYALGDNTVVRINPTTGKGQIAWQAKTDIATWVEVMRLGTADSFDATIHIPRAGDITLLSQKKLDIIWGTLLLPSAGPDLQQAVRFIVPGNRLEIYNGTEWVSVTLT